MPTPVHDLGEMTYALKDDEEKAIEKFLILSKHKSKYLKTVWYLDCDIHHSSLLMIMK